MNGKFESKSSEALKWNELNLSTNTTVPFVYNHDKMTEKKIERTDKTNQYEKINFDKKDQRDNMFEKFKKQQENANHFIQLIALPKEK